MLSPVRNVTLDGWSLDDHKPVAGPQWNGRDTFFVFYAYASDPEPLTFSVDLKVNKSYVRIEFLTVVCLKIVVICDFMLHRGKNSS
jgi:hypothetical protein